MSWSQKKKWVFGSGGWTGRLLSVTYNELSESVAFGQKLRYFTDQNGPKWEHAKMNFLYFQIPKWMLQTVITEKVNEKNEVVCLVSMFPS